MEFEDIANSRLNCPPQIQPLDQTSSRFIDRFIRLKTRYWNRGFAIVLISFIGLIIQWFQYLSLMIIGLEKDYDVDFICYVGWIFGFISGGVLATVYSADKVFGTSFIISLILHIMEAMNSSKAYLHILPHFCIGMTLTISMSASHRIYTFWVPQNKQSLLHVPIVLWSMVYYYKIQIYYDFKYMHEVSGIVGNKWFILWLIVIRGDRTQTRYSGTNVVSIRRPTISEIPWKSFCTSMPVIALVLSNMCDASSFLLNGSYYNSYDIYLKYDQSSRKYTIILLLFIFVLVELIPEIAVFFSVTKIRKIFSCLYFVSMGIIYYLEAFPKHVFLFLDNNEFVYLIYNIMPYFKLFGIDINHLDIAPQYSSLLYAILATIYHITFRFSASILQNRWIFGELNHVQFCILGVVINLAAAVFSAIFISAELQPWAIDKPVKENQRNMQEEVNLVDV